MNKSNINARSSIAKLITESRFSNHRFNSNKPIDREKAENVGKKIFEYYNKENCNILKDHEIGEMMSDIYNGIGIKFSPSDNDILEFKNVLDSDNDNLVNLNDMQSLMIKYLGK